MEQQSGKFLMFGNRLEKVYRHLRKQAEKQGVSCYRVYDHDLPEFPLIIEFYEGMLYVSEYRRRHGFSDEEYEKWWLGCVEIITNVLGVKKECIFIKLRQKKQGRSGQYQKLNGEKNEFIISENGLKFFVNLSGYLDTGLFLDHRLTRQMVRSLSTGKNVLNLFSYTGSFSVYAIAGGAENVVSVDLSKTYLDWSLRNMQINFPGCTTYEAVHADVKQYIASCKNTFDLIILDPPTFSNSKRMEDFLDIQRDHAGLINKSLDLLNKGGSLFFSTNYTKFLIDIPSINASGIKDITAVTTPFDFKGKLKRQCFRISK